MNDQEYEYVLAVAVEGARDLIAQYGDKLKEDEDLFHDKLFDIVLSEVDKSEYSYLEAKPVSEVCSEVESDILHGDILGL